MRGYSINGNLELKIQDTSINLDMEKIIILPDMLKSVLKYPGVTNTTVLDGDNVMAYGPQGQIEMTEEQTSSALHNMRRELFTNYLVLLYDRAELSCQAIEPAHVDDVMCDGIYVSGDSVDGVLLYLDRDTHFLCSHQLMIHSPEDGSPVLVDTRYEGWRAFGDYMFASHISTMIGDDQSTALSVSSFSILPKSGADAANLLEACLANNREAVDSFLAAGESLAGNDVAAWKIMELLVKIMHTGPLAVIDNKPQGFMGESSGAEKLSMTMTIKLLLHAHADPNLYSVVGFKKGGREESKTVPGVFTNTIGEDGQIVRGRDGMSALQFAEHCGLHDLVASLREAGAE